MADNTKQEPVESNIQKIMQDTSRQGEKAAELLLEDIYADLKSRKGPKDLEDGMNDAIKSIVKGAQLMSPGNEGYNLKFEIVDDNNDGKWNEGEKVQVHNSSRFFFRQPAPFNLDGIPDSKNGTDGMLKNRTQLEQELSQ